MSRKPWIIKFRRQSDGKYSIAVDYPGVGDANEFPAILPPRIDDLWTQAKTNPESDSQTTRQFRKDVANLSPQDQFFSAQNTETLKEIGDRMLVGVLNPENNRLGEDNIAALRTLIALNDGVDLEFDLSQTPELSGIP